VSSPASREPWSDRVALACGVIAPLFALYWCSAPRTLPEADAGEFAAIAVRGGIPHPPGYPLQALLLQAFAQLPLGLIRSLVLSSLLYACAAALLLACTLRARGVRAFDAAISTLAVFASTNVWRDATSFEPFALNLLLGAALIHVSERLARPALVQARWLFATGVLFGLGLCNHHSLAFMAPLPFTVLLVQRRFSPRVLAWLAVGFGVGATPLAAFRILRTQAGWIWGDWHDFWPRLIVHVFRREYGTFTLASDAGSGGVDYGPLRLLRTLPGALSYVFFGFALLSIARGTRRLGRYERSDGFALGNALSFAGTGLLFPAFFGLAATPLSDLIADRFFALPTLHLALPIALGLAALRPILNKAYAIVAVALLALHAGLVWPHAERAEHHFYEDHLRNVFSIAEPGSTLIVAGDGGFSGGLYGQYVLGHSAVRLIISGLEQPWYLKRVAQTLGARSTDAGAAPRGPLYLLDVPRVQRARQPVTYPVGPLLRVVDAYSPLPSAREVFELNQTLFAKLRLPTPRALQDMDAWEADELLDYERAWDMIERRLHNAGQTTLAAVAARYRAAFTLPSRR
jgi:hypothetical protein